MISTPAKPASEIIVSISVQDKNVCFKSGQKIP